jgi:PAS domain S-box-containing protein
LDGISAHIVTNMTRRPPGLDSVFSMKVLLTALAVSLGYYLGAKIGFALTFQPHPVSVLWPPNAILTAGLLLTSPRVWWALILAAFPAHWGAQLESDVPTAMIMCWFISNCCEALIGAGLARYFVGGPLHLTSLREVGIFSFTVVFAGPFLSSFLDAGFVRLNDWGQGGYWEIWRIRFISNVLAALAVTALIVTWANGGTVGLRNIRPLPSLEAVLLFVGLAVISFAVLYQLGSGADSAFLYLPLPFLLWAAVRFGSRGISTAISIVAFLAIWSAAHGHGPFSGGSSEQNALAIQVFLIAMSLPLMFLAGLMEERTRGEIELRASEERYRELVESQTDLVCRFLPDTTLTFVNEAYCRFFGRCRHDLVGMKFIDLVPAVAHERVLANIAQAAEGRCPVTHEHEVAMPDGSAGWQQWIDYPIAGTDGRLTELQGIGRDITERVRAELALKEREARIKLTTESANLGLWVYDPRQDSAWMSDKGRTIYGFAPDEPISRASFFLAVHPDDRDTVVAAFNRALDLTNTFEIEHRIKSNSGDTTWVIVRGRGLYDEQGNTLELIGVTVDVTAQKKIDLERQAHREEVAHLNRVAMLGEIAISLAHELSQPLTGIVSNAAAGKRLIKPRNAGLRELRDLLSDIAADGHRAGEVVQSIRRMGRKKTTIRENLSLNDVARNAIHMVRPQAVFHSCELTTSLDKDLPLIDGNSVELQQVVINLVINAIESMRQMPALSRRVEIATKANGHDTAELCVRDFGVGIAESSQDRIFEHFFTTKPDGLGMGLTIASSIVHSHGGALTGERVESGGSRFRLTLPVSRT